MNSGSSSDIPIPPATTATAVALELKNSQNNTTATAKIQRNNNISYGSSMQLPQHPTTLGELYHAGSTVTGSLNGDTTTTTSGSNKMTATVDVKTGIGYGGGIMSMSASVGVCNVNNIAAAVGATTTAAKINSSTSSISMHDFDNRQSINKGAASLSGLMVGSCSVLGSGGGVLGSKPEERYVWEMRARSPNVTPASTVLNSPDLNTDMQYSIHPHQRQLQQIRVGRSPGSQFEQHNILPQVGVIHIFYFPIAI